MIEIWTSEEKLEKKLKKKKMWLFLGFSDFLEIGSKNYISDEKCFSSFINAKSSKKIQLLFVELIK